MSENKKQRKNRNQNRSNQINRISNNLQQTRNISSNNLQQNIEPQLNNLNSSNNFLHMLNTSNNLQQNLSSSNNSSRNDDSSSYINLNSRGYQKRAMQRNTYFTNRCKMKSFRPVKQVKWTKDDLKNQELFHKAVEKGDFKVMQGFLKDGVFPNAKDKNGDFPIHSIFKLKKPEDVLKGLKVMIDEKYKHEVNLNSRNKNGETPLHLACKLKNHAVVAYILDKGANPDLQDYKGNTALHVISELDNKKSSDENYKILNEILDYGANIQLKNSSNKYVSQVPVNQRFKSKFMDHQFDMNEDVTGGDVEVGLSWYNRNDLDVHCTCRCNKHIYYGDKKCKSCRGYLDYDMNVSVCDDPKVSSDTPVEHIYWPRVKKGRYKIFVIHFKKHSGVPVSSEFLIVMKVKGETVYETSGCMHKVKENQVIFEFSFDSDENLSIYKNGKTLKTINVKDKEEEKIEKKVDKKEQEKGEDKK